MKIRSSRMVPAFGPAWMETMWVVFGIVVLINSCSPSGRTEIPPTGHSPTPGEISAWRSQQQLSVATDEEISAAKRCEKALSQNRAVSNDGKLKVVFHPGDLIGGRYVNLSTSSNYALLDASGNLLAKAPSCLANTQGVKGEELGVQLVWFAPDGNRVVVYEYGSYGHGPPPLTILFVKNSENNDSWNCKFLELPFFDQGYDGEGAHAKCMGISGDALLIDAFTRDGRISKKEISGLKEKYPFPFTIG